jgi:hypothetical protein
MTVRSDRPDLDEIIARVLGDQSALQGSASVVEHVIVACGPLLEILWAAHRAPTDFLILGDVRRPE